MVERYVQFADAEKLALDGDGFLDLAAAVGARPAAGLAGHAKSFVLLAAGGAGKSEVLEDLCEREGGVAVDLLGLGRADVGRVIGEAAASGRPVYLDALDEALLTEPVLPRLVNRAMSAPDAAGVAWRLACRPSAWTSAFVDGVDVEKLRLLPMTRDGARGLLASINVGEGFLDALVAAGQSRLSASLLHFIAAAKQWQEDGRLPRRRADVLESEVRRLLTEREDVRQPSRVNMDVRRAAAGRLAFWAAFGGVSRIAARTGAAGDVVAITELPSVPEPDRPDVTIGREVYEEVLGSALFDYAPGDAMSFRHQEYVDFLGAKYAVDRSPVRSQVAALLGLTDGVLPGSMVAVAAWMVALRPELASVVVPANAAALVESEVDLPPVVREAVVEALLADARIRDLRPLWSLDLAVVVHPGLETQLAERLVAGVDSPFEVWWICRLGLAGGLSAIAPAALEMALDSRLPTWARRPAIAVVTSFGAERAWSDLLEGLVIDQASDPQYELRAGLLDGLYPKYLATAQLLSLLKRPSFNYFGSYRLFLNEFAARIPAVDLLEALAWARELQSWPSVESRRWVGDMALKITERAIAVSDDPAVLEQVAALILAAVGNARFDKLWAQDPFRRRRMALIVAGQLAESRWPVLIQLGLVTRGDHDWLTNAIHDLETTGKDVLARCLVQLSAGKEEERAVEYEGGDRLDPAVLKAAIVAARGEFAVWAKLPVALAAEEDVESLFDCDFASRPGWTLLTPEEQQEVITRGLEYVAEREPDSNLWAGKAQFRHSISEWSGVYLLTTLARRAPERLSELPSPAWARWAPAIANAWAYRNERLLGILAGLAPAEAKEAIRDAVGGSLASRTEPRSTDAVRPELC